MRLFETIPHIWNNKTLTRTFMNNRCRSVSLENQRVLDLGAGAQPGTYHEYFSTPARLVETADMKAGDTHHTQINFEKDTLPFEDATFDTVLSFNLFEHIYNYQHIVSEAYRVTKPGGQLIGFVPFLVNYHPDPHDYFRYTREALTRIFEDAGYVKSNIEEIGRGPCTVNYNNIVLSIPRIVRVVILPLYWVLDSFVLWRRPLIRKRYPLGYFFVVQK